VYEGARAKFLLTSLVKGFLLSAVVPEEAKVVSSWIQ
jgi:hypothetical protein